MDNTYAIVNGKIITDKAIVKGYAVVVKNGVIYSIIKKQYLDVSLNQIDVKGAYVGPGFIDLQLNGCGGVLLNDDISVKTIEVMHETNLQYGCTSFLPTLITASKQDICKAIEVVLEAYKKYPNSVIGIHIEGPFISLTKKGIHNARYIRSITEEEADIIIKASKAMPVMLTLAPEVNDLSIIKKLTQGGVKVSLGHTNATYNQAVEAIEEAGVNHTTHLFNAMSPLTHREPGTVTAVLNHNTVDAGIIVDGYHVDFNLIALVKRIKQEHLYIVTDAATAAGDKNMKTFEFGGNTVYVKEGKAVNAEGVLAGSLITMIDSVANTADKVGVGVLEAVKMASTYPARVMKLPHIGSIKPGCVANIAIFDCDYNMHYTICNGSIKSLK